MMKLSFRSGDKELLTDRISQQMQVVILDKGIEYTDAWTDGTVWLLGLLAELTEEEKGVSPLGYLIKADGVVH